MKFFANFFQCYRMIQVHSLADVYGGRDSSKKKTECKMLKSIFSVKYKVKHSKEAKVVWNVPHKPMFKLFLTL